MGNKDIVNSILVPDDYNRKDIINDILVRRKEELPPQAVGTQNGPKNQAREVGSLLSQ